MMFGGKLVSRFIQSRNFPRASQRFLTHGARMAGRIGGGSGILGATGGTACGEVGAGVSGALTSPGWLPGGGQVLAPVASSPIFVSGNFISPILNAVKDFIASMDSSAWPMDWALTATTVSSA